MTVQDDLRRLSELDSIYLGSSLISYPAGGVTSWYKGRLQQANDGSWIFRSISSDGTVVGFQLGPANQGWTSSESPSAGIIVSILITMNVGAVGNNPAIAIVYLQQQLPQELTN
jgi:hypothetical protein